MQQNTPKRSRILYADLLRIISGLAIIVAHVSSARWDVAPINGLEWWLLNIGVATSHWCVPLFFMLSGMFILDPNKTLSYKKLATVSVPKILIPLLFWSFAYKAMAIVTNLMLGLREVTPMDYLGTVISVFFRGISWYHLWFLYPLLGMYILSPIFRVFTKNARKSDVIYLFILYVLFAWLKPFYNEVLPLPLAFAIPDLVGLTASFIFGYYFANYKFTHKQSIIIYIIGISCLVGQSYFYTHSMLVANKPIYPFYLDNQSFNMMLIAIMLFVFFKNFTANADSMLSKLRNNRLVTLLSECTFGIYLVHAAFLNIFSAYFKFETNTIHPLLAFPLLIILTYICSFITTYLIKKIPIVGKWIV